MFLAFTCNVLSQGELLTHLTFLEGVPNIEVLVLVDNLNFNIGVTSGNPPTCTTLFVCTIHNSYTLRCY